MAVVTQPTRRGLPWSLVTILILALVATVLAAAAAAIYIAYDRQSNRVEKLQARDAKIERDHVAIGAKFAEQSTRFQQAIQAVNTAYGRGFRAGRKAGRLPAQFAALWPSVAQGFLVPLSVPEPLRGKPVRIGRTQRTYTIRWRGVALFASGRLALSDWTAQAWPGNRRRVRVGRRVVRRMVGPFGVVYAWRERNKSYAVVTLPRNERFAAPVIRVLG